MPERRSTVQTVARRVKDSPAPTPVKAAATVVPKRKSVPARSTGTVRVVDTDNSDNPSGSRRIRSNPPRTRGRGREQRAPSLSPNPKVGALMAEWLFGVVVISVTVPMQGAQKGYGATITNIMFRLTGLTGFFFVLALLGNSQRASRFVVWFGLLIDLGILFTASTQGTFGALTAVFKGQPITDSSGAAITPAADVTSSQEPPSELGDASAPALSVAPSSSGSNAPISA